MNDSSTDDRVILLRLSLYFAVMLLMTNVLVRILYEYRYYFPPDFHLSAFLTGRQSSFHGLYRVAFYTHIVVGPLALIIGAGLLRTGLCRTHRRIHQWMGRVQAFLVLVLIVPSGLVMATHAFAGPVAGVGFALLALVTAGCVSVSVYHARRGELVIHRRWASRLLILLCSPLILRLITGATIVTQTDAPWIYPLNAWISWLIPLIAYEIWWRYDRLRRTEVVLNPVATKSIV